MNSPKTILGLAVLLVLVVLTVIFGTQVLQLVPQVREEQQRTPTPSPVYGNVMAVTPDPSLPTPPPILKRGSKGSDVIALQNRLTELGYNPGSVDGEFGPGTEEALIQFQQQNGLEPDGVAGAATNTVLYSSSARAYTAPQATATPVPTAPPTQEPTASPRAAVPKMYVTADGMPLLVNREHLLPEDYVPYELVTMNDYCPSGVVKIKYSSTLAEKEAVDALLIMLQAGIDEGLKNWQVSAAYRTTEQQQKLFNNKVRTYMNENGLSRSKAVSATRKTVADPGTSEHHLGTAFDITVPGASFGSTKQAKWLSEHCWEYGFILRYTKEKQDITGFLAEPWHFRYVGTEHSLIMRDEDLCLEEYLELYGGMTFEEDADTAP
ncbi:MAG: D-alanyl-D-alanine carboxypeptidase family protein [Clostridiales bacterium]|nr:D-alanyl-D-alanine carboxypeptidase family protein [Clostridiales bacterium]